MGNIKVQEQKEYKNFSMGKIKKKKGGNLKSDL
jgi:hypothetical protein